MLSILLVILAIIVGAYFGLRRPKPQIPSAGVETTATTTTATVDARRDESTAEQDADVAEAAEDEATDELDAAAMKGMGKKRMLKLQKKAEARRQREV